LVLGFLSCFTSSLKEQERKYLYGMKMFGVLLFLL